MKNYNWWLFKLRAKRFIYKLIWYINKPSIIDAKHPLSYSVGIFDADNTNLCKNHCIISYNNKTKEAVVCDIKSFKRNTPLLEEKIYLPNTSMRLI